MTMRTKSRYVLLLACLLAGICAGAQEAGYYLLPDFGQGMIYFNDRPPLGGRLNICAADHTLRFLDDSGQERILSDVSHVTRVIIDGVPFLRDNGFFYRMYPVTLQAGLALKRGITVRQEGRKGAYGTVSHTSSIQGYNHIYGAGGESYHLQKDQQVPVDVSETVFLYLGNDVLPFNKRNLRKCFPQKKEAIESYLQSGGQLPGRIDEALELLKSF